MSRKQYSRRDVLRTTAGVMGVGLLAACAAPVAPGSEGAAIPSEQRQGVLWGLQYDPHVAAYQRLADLFESQGGGTYEVQPQAWPIPPKVIAALAAGTQPDVACIMGEQLTSLHLHQALVPCTEQVYNHMGVDPEESFVGDAIGAYTWQGEIWGVPTEANGVGNMVNVPSEDVIALGLEDQYPPLNGEVFFESYASMWELAQALQIEEDGKVTRWGLSSQGWDDMSYLGILRTLLDKKGQDWWDLENKQFHINTEEGMEAMRLYVETPVEMGIETQLDQSHVDAALAGKVALARGNGTPSLPMSWELGYTYLMCGAPMVFEGELPIFAGEGGWGFISLKQAKNPDMAVEFLRMLVTHEGQVEYAKIYGGAPHTSWKDLVGVYDHFSEPDPDGPAVGMARVLQEHLQPLTRFEGVGFGSIAEIGSAITEGASEVRQGNIGSEEAVELIQSRCEAQYEEWVSDVRELGMEP
ncbi:MAG: extracellular solute-binding protein [Caldilineaceae bacterium]|nr:extracellular solute-binding protein [Caldilineaceae bacterium]